MVTAVCNVFINSDLKSKLFKETFPLVYAISDNWLVNIRGKHREDVTKYIKQTFPNYEENCIFFSGLDDGNWAKSTQKMLEKSRYDYIYVFLEDHFLLKPLDHFRDVILDMKKNGIDYFQYSFFNVGLHTQSIEKIYPDFTDYFFSFLLEAGKLRDMIKEHKVFYPYSLASVSSKSYFLRLLEIENKTLIMVPVFFQAIIGFFYLSYPRNRSLWFMINRLSSKIGWRFVIYSPATPFNLEKSLFDCDKILLPIKVSFLKSELFANWDDDNGISDSSLIKRGLYPKSFVADSVDHDPPFLKKYRLLKGKSMRSQYYADKPRITNIPLKFFSVESGALQITSSLGSFCLSPGEHIWVFANIPHVVMAQEDCGFNVYISD